MYTQEAPVRMSCNRSIVNIVTNGEFLLGIQKRDLTRYLKKRFLPQFGEEWRIYGGATIIRREGCLLQGLHFDRSRYSFTFVPWYFVQVLAIPGEHLALTIGERLQDQRPSDLWLDWAPEDDTLVQTILKTVKAQAGPPFNQPLTVESAIQYIETSCRKSPNQFVRRSLGVLYGIQGHLAEANTQFQQAEKQVRSNLAWCEKQGKNPPEWNFRCLQSINEFTSKLTTREEFLAYCDEQMEKTVQAMKLPV